MKKLFPILLIALVFVSCSSEQPNDPQAPPTGTDGLYNPPPSGGSISGTWIDSWGARLTQSGIYDPNIPAQLNGEIRVSGNWVWFDLRGGGHRRLYSGIIQGDVIIGYEELSTWSPTQGILDTFPAKSFNWTRMK